MVLRVVTSICYFFPHCHFLSSRRCGHQENIPARKPRKQSSKETVAVYMLLIFLITNPRVTIVIVYDNRVDFGDLEPVILMTRTLST